MRRLAALAIVLAACGDDGATARAPMPRSPAVPTARRDPAPRAAPPETSVPADVARSPLLLDGDLGGWIPAAEDCAEAHRLGALVAREELDEAFGLLTREDRTRVLRAGLRLRDTEAALRAALLAEPKSLELWEQRRAARLLADAALDPSRFADQSDHSATYIWKLERVGASSDATRVLERLATARDNAVLEQDFPGGLGGLLRPEHVPLVVKLCQSDDDRVRAVGYRLLVALMERTDEFRTEIESVLPPETDDGTRALGEIERAAIRPALADWRARGRPQDRPAPPSKDEAFRVLLQSDGGVVATIEEVFASATLVGRIRAAACAPGPWPSARAERWSEGIADALVASDLNWSGLADAALAAPGCRTRAMAEAIVARLPNDAGGAAILQMDPPLVSFLETAAPEAFLWKLRGWAAAGDDRDAPRWLMLLRDAASAPLVVAWCERLRESNWAHVPWDDLGPLRHESVRAFLVRHVEEAEGWSPAVRFAYEALAVQDRFPEGIHEWPWPGPDEERAPIAKLILDRRPVDAFAAALATHPDDVVEGEGAVRDPRVRAHLESIRSRRELGLYAQATAELARMGDPAARAEHDAALREGRTAWIAALSWDQRTLDGPLAAIETWTAALESGEDASAIGCDFFAAWFGWDPNDEETPGFTPAGRFRAWWARHEGRFVLSRTAGEFVPAPR